MRWIADRNGGATRMWLVWLLRAASLLLIAAAALIARSTFSAGGGLLAAVILLADTLSLLAPGVTVLGLAELRRLQLRPADRLHRAAGLCLAWLMRLEAIVEFAAMLVRTVALGAFGTAPVTTALSVLALLTPTAGVLGVAEVLRFQARASSPAA